VKRYGERVTDGSEEVGPARAPDGFPPDRLLDPNDQVLGSPRPALHPHDVLELSGELGPVPARAARAEVRREEASPVRVELSVEIILDLSQDFFATNL
jgi:hypothetical protein